MNALLLFAVAIYVLIEAARRLFEEPEVLGVPMLIVATLGLLVNLAAFMVLREGSKQSLNVEGAYLEVLADTVGSVGVIVAAIALQLFGWGWIDPVIGALIGLWILPRTWRLGRQAIRVLLQAAPPHVDLAALRAELGGLPGVVDVHDLHVWTLTSEMTRIGALDGQRRRRSPRCPRPGRRLAGRPLPDRPRHVPGRTRNPRRLHRRPVVNPLPRRVFRQRCRATVKTSGRHRTDNYRQARKVGCGRRLLVLFGQSARGARTS